MSGEMGREKGEGEDSGELGGMEWMGWRKGGYGSREVAISIKGAILRLERDLKLEGFPDVQGDVPSLFLGLPRRGRLNWPYPIATLMNILHITIEPSSSGD